MGQIDDRLYVVVDGGGTATRVRIMDPAGRSLGAASAGPGNPSGNPERAFESIRDAIRIAYRDAGLAARTTSRDALCLALAGTEARGRIDELRSKFDFAHISIHGDAAATVIGALGQHDGVVAGIGTGSFFVSQLRGAMRRIGGHGFQISDECSAAWLGRQLLRRAMQSHDGLIDSSPLIDQAMNRFGKSVPELVAYSVTADGHGFGRLAPLVTDAASNGDPTALAILAQATDDLHRILDALDARSIGRICLTGGMASIYRPRLRDDYRGCLAEPLGDALDGARHLLMRDIETSRHGL